MFSSRDTASCQEKSLAAHFSANKPHEDLHYSPIHATESDNASEIVSHPEYHQTFQYKYQVSAVSQYLFHLRVYPLKELVIIHSPLLLTVQKKEVCNPLT